MNTINATTIVNCRDCHNCDSLMECSIGKALSVLPIEISLNEIQEENKNPISSFIDGDTFTGVDLVCSEYFNRKDLSIDKYVRAKGGSSYKIKFLGCDSCKKCISKDVCKYRDSVDIKPEFRSFDSNEVISMLADNPVECTVGISLHCSHFTHENIITEVLISRRSKIIPNGY